MSREHGGERDSLAPVIPLFGGPVPEQPAPEPPSLPEDEWSSLEVPDDAPQVETAWAAVTAVIDGRGDGDPRETAGDAADRPGSEAIDSTSPIAWHPTWASDHARHQPDPADAADGGTSVEVAEKALLKKLRTRSLSVSEARGILRGHELDDASIEGVLASMEEYGYLDDAALAEQLVHIGVDRKGQGRQLIAQALMKRGIPRDIADAALATLPDDDLERALEFARSKVRSLRALDRDTALRRLSGQLARRGYGGSLAMTAARIALDENPSGSSGVRFR